MEPIHYHQKILWVSTSNAGTQEILRKLYESSNNSFDPITSPESNNVVTCYYTNGAIIQISLTSIFLDVQADIDLAQTLSQSTFHGIVFLFDPTNPKSFTAIQHWYQGNLKWILDIPIVVMSSRQLMVDNGFPNLVPDQDLKQFLQKSEAKVFIRVSEKFLPDLVEAFQQIGQVCFHPDQAHEEDRIGREDADPDSEN